MANAEQSPLDKKEVIAKLSRSLPNNPFTALDVGTTGEVSVKESVPVEAPKALVEGETPKVEAEESLEPAQTVKQPEPMAETLPPQAERFAEVPREERIKGKRKSKDEDGEGGRRKKTRSATRGKKNGKKTTKTPGAAAAPGTEPAAPSAEQKSVSSEKTALETELELRGMRRKSAFARFVRFLQNGEKLDAKGFFDDVQKTNSIRQQILESGAEDGKFKDARIVEKSGKDVAKMIQNLIAFSKDQEFKQRKPKDRRHMVLDFIASFPDVTSANREFRDDLVRALITEGVLTEDLLPKEPERKSRQDEKEKEPSDPALEHIIKRVEKTYTFPRAGEEVSGWDIADGIRWLVRHFETPKFKAQLPKEQEEEIVYSLQKLTDNDELRADLRWYFEQKGLLTPLATPKKVESSDANPPVGASGTGEAKPKVAEEPIETSDQVPPEDIPDENPEGNKFPEPQTLPEILAEVRRCPKNFKITEGGETHELTPAEMAKTLLGYFLRQSDVLKGSSTEEREKEIEADLNTIDHKILRSDLRKLFERNGRLRSNVPVAGKSDLTATAVFKKQDVMGGQRRGQETVELPPEGIGPYMRAKNARGAVKPRSVVGKVNVVAAGAAAALAANSAEGTPITIPPKPKTETPPTPPPAPVSEAAPAKPPAPQEAPAAPTVAHVHSPEKAVAKAILEDSGGFDLGKAMDVPGFTAFLAETERLGRKVDMADNDDIKERFRAFAFKDSVAEEVYKIHSERIAKDLNLSLDDAGKQAVREHLEKQAHESPRLINQLFTQFEYLKNLPGEIDGLETQVAELRKTLTPEGQSALRKPLEEERRRIEEKHEKVALALKTNHWLKGAGWTHSIWQVFSSESKKKAEARKELRKSKLVKSYGLFGLSTADLEKGMENTGNLLKGVGNRLATLEDEFKKSTTDKEAKIKELDEKRFLAHQLLEHAELNLFRDSELNKKLAGMAQRKIIDQIYSFRSEKEENQTAEDAVKASELFEKALRASLTKGAGESGDYLEGFDVNDTQEKIDMWLSLGIKKDVERAVSRALALSSGRFKALEDALAKLTAKEKLGPKSRAEVRARILGRLREEIDKIVALPKDEKTEEGRRRARENQEKALHIKATIARQAEAIRNNK